MNRVHTPPRIGGVERLLRQFIDKRWPYLPEYYLINRRTCGLGRWAALRDARRASLWIRDLPRESEPSCDGLCVTAADIGIPGDAVAYPHPGCPLHSPGRICECGQPDRCLSPTHGQVSMAEARAIRNSQRRGAGPSAPPEETTP